MAIKSKLIIVCLLTFATILFLCLPTKDKKQTAATLNTKGVEITHLEKSSDLNSEIAFLDEVKVKETTYASKETSLAAVEGTNAPKFETSIKSTPALNDDFIFKNNKSTYYFANLDSFQNPSNNVNYTQDICREATTCFNNSCCLSSWKKLWCVLACNADYRVYFDNHRKPFIEFESLLPIYQTAGSLEHTVYLQGGYIRHNNWDVRNVYSLGLGYRYLDPCQRFMLGTYAFYDYLDKRSHQIYTVGGEFQSPWFSLQVNYFHPITGKKQCHNCPNDILLIRSRPVDGFDLTVTAPAPFFPWLDFGFTYYDRHGLNSDYTRTESFGTAYITDCVSLEFGHRVDGKFDRAICVDQKESHNYIILTFNFWGANKYEHTLCRDPFVSCCWLPKCVCAQRLNKVRRPHNINFQHQVTLIPKNGNGGNGGNGNGGCTLTQGFWKNHEGVWPIPTDTELCNGLTYPEIFDTPPGPGGEFWFAVSHQWIAATLNVENGADDSFTIDFGGFTDFASLIAASESLLADNCENLASSTVLNTNGFDGTVTTSDLNDILTDYNEGTIGPGHCGP